MKHHIKNLIQTITTGTPAEVKLAQRQLEKFWHDFYLHNCEEGAGAFGAFLEELENFDAIKDADHQASFIYALKWPLWGGVGEEHFEEWAAFFLTQIQNPSGKIRQAVINATQYLVHDLRFDSKYDYEPAYRQGMTRLEFEKIVSHNIARFGAFVMEVEDLIRHYHEPRFRRYKYISSLPAGVYKSLNILIVEKLLISDFYKNIYHDYLDSLRTERDKFAPPMMSLTEILERRWEMEEKLRDLIKRTDSALSFDEIKELIYNEDGQDCMRKLMSNFMKDQDIAQFNKDWQVVSAAWNYWPHKKLGGISPAEKALEY